MDHAGSQAYPSTHPPPHLLLHLYLHALYAARPALAVPTLECECELSFLGGRPLTTHDAPLGAAVICGLIPAGLSRSLFLGHTLQPGIFPSAALGETIVRPN
jgi:hypothetical protein